MDSLSTVLVSVLGTGLVTGTGAVFWLGKNRLTVQEHDRICEPRMALIQKDIAHMQEGIRDIKEDVAFLVERNGGRS